MEVLRQRYAVFKCNSEIIVKFTEAIRGGIRRRFEQVAYRIEAIILNISDVHFIRNVIAEKLIEYCWPPTFTNNITVEVIV